VKDGSENPFMKRSVIKDCSVQPGLVAALNNVIYTIALQQGHAQKNKHHKKTDLFSQIGSYLKRIFVYTNKPSMLK
jgi:hypothetical protein